jgi:hemin uptake protein HemP
MTQPRENDHGQKPTEKRPSTLRQVTSEELLQGRTELLIQHGEETYRLNLTRNGKLILHK